MMIRQIILTILSLFAILLQSPGQEKKTAALHELTFEELCKIYEASAGNDLQYINGSMYTEAFPGCKGHPFFNSEGWYEGELVMQGKKYEGLTLRYDLYRDQLLYNHIQSSGSYIVVLNKYRIDSFTMDGHHFCKLQSPGSGSEEGFYELLSEGKASYYVKWTKRLSESTPEYNGEFSLFTESYIQKKEEFSRINRRSGILKALEDHEKEIREYIRANRIVVRPGNEMKIKSIVDFYNKLTP